LIERYYLDYGASVSRLYLCAGDALGTQTALIPWV
jgi:hypothetical protein